MPPPVEESESPSDDESIASDGIAEPQGVRDPTRPGPVSAGHGSGGLAHEGKRKAGLSGDEPPSKARRTEREDSDEEDDAEDDEDDDEEDEEDDEDEHQDDQDIPNATNYAQQSFGLSAPRAADAGAGGQFTALMLYQAAFPHLYVKPVQAGSAVANLAMALPKRTPVVKPKFNNVKPQNQVSYLMQATGDQVPDHAACEKCAKNAGVYIGACVVVRDPLIMTITGGACANCWYSRQGSRCTFRLTSDSAPDKQRHGLTLAPSHPTQIPPAVAETARPAPIPAIPAERAHPPAAAGAQLHPGFVAALAAGTVSLDSGPATAPASLKPNAPANRVPRVNGTPGADRVAAWEKRYRALTTDVLIATNRHLSEWQEDLSTRLLAMNKVVLERLRRSEGQG